MSYFEKYVLGIAANDAAREVITNYNDDKRKAFLQGAEWAARYFLKCLDVHPMEDDATRKYLNGHRIAYIEEALRAILSKPKDKP